MTFIPREFPTSRAVVAFVLISVAAVGVFAADRTAEFRKRKSDLVELRTSCEQMYGASQSDCMSDYAKKAAKYKNDFAEFKADLDQEKIKMQQTAAPKGKKDAARDVEDRNGVLVQYKDFLKTSCQTEVSENCAVALYQVGYLTFQNEEDDFRVKDEKYGTYMQQWEDRDKKGQEPKAPKRDHSGSIEFYKELRTKYPNFREMPEVDYILGFIYDMQGFSDKSIEILTDLVTRFPEHYRAVQAHLRIGEYYYLDRKYRQAIEHYEKIPLSYSGAEAGLALYHKADCFYSLADYEKAAQLFYQYVVLADQKKIKGDLRNEALEFMAICWADMDDGVQIAYDFLKDKGHSWDKDLYFQMGEKNRAHDRLAEARKSFEHLLRIDPDYSKAPIADIAMVEILLVEKKGVEAQEARMSLVERYRPGSQWYVRNSANKEAVEKAQEAVKAAMFQIPVYYHLQAVKDKENLDEKGLAEAKRWYEEYLQKYNESTWAVYEVHQNIGNIYQLLKQFRLAATQYEWCMNADASAFGPLPAEKKSALLTPEDAAYNRVYMLDLLRQEMLKSMKDDYVAAYSTSETGAYMAAVDEFMKKFGKSASAPDIAYNLAYVHYHAKQYPKAIDALSRLLADFPNHKYSNLIRGMLAKSLLENGQYVESEKVYNELLNRTPKDSVKQLEDTRDAIAAAIYKQAEVKAKGGDNKAAANLYLNLVRRFPGVKIADKALFDAGEQLDSAKEVSSAVQVLLRINVEYPNSALRIKSVLRAATAYKNDKNMRLAAQTFLILPAKFPKDSASFSAIGYAADMYEKIPDWLMAAKTYESALQLFPGHERTAGFLYNAGQIYEEQSKDWNNAVRVYRLVVEKFPQSTYASDAAYSVPLILEKQGRFADAARAYEEFTGRSKDLGKTFLAMLAVIKIDMEKLGAPEKALEKCGDMKALMLKEKENPALPAPIIAEAMYLGGEIVMKRMLAVNLDAPKDKDNAARLKSLLKDMDLAMDYYTASAEREEQIWTLRSYLRLGDLMLAIGDKLRKQKINASNPYQVIGLQVNQLKGIPGFLDKANALYRKSLDLAREQGMKSGIIDTTGMRYMATFYDKGMIFEEVGKLLGSSPMPTELESAEDTAEYKAQLDDYIFQARQATKPIYGTGLKAAQYYRLERLAETQKIKSRLKEIDPEAPELNLENLPAEAPGSVFVDPKYKANMEKIEATYQDASLSDAEKSKVFRKLEEAARAEINQLSKQATPAPAMEKK